MSLAEGGKCASNWPKCFYANPITSCSMSLPTIWILNPIIWLEQFLREYSGAVVTISHDKQFLDNVTTRTVEIELGKLYDYKAPIASLWRCAPNDGKSNRQPSKTSKGLSPRRKGPSTVLWPKPPKPRWPSR